MSETQVSVGTITSPPPRSSRSAAMVMRLADEPELTNTLCLTPSHCDHSRSNSRTLLDWVSIASSRRRSSITASRSSRTMLLRIKGQASIRTGP